VTPENRTASLRRGAIIGLILSFSTMVWATGPTVVSTDPVNGATGVAADLEAITITFSEEMGNGLSLSGLGGSFSISWSPDHRVLTVARTAGAPAWEDGRTLEIVLNPPPHYGFADTEGNLLATYTFAFTVGESPIPGVPTVLATAPANGAADVSEELETISVEFSKAMAEAVGVSFSGAWPVSGNTPHSWSVDGRTLTIRRDDAPAPLPSFEVLTVHLNRNGSGFEDLDGTPLGPYAFTFTLGGPGADDPPSVQSSIPADGTRGVGLFTESFTVAFDKPMSPDVNLVCTTSNWDVDASEISWAPDGRTLVVTRPNDGTLPSTGDLISFTLNPGGDPGFKDVDDNPLPPTTISFFMEGDGRMLKIRPQDSSHDFAWPYYLWIPQNVAATTAILVEPNNTGTVDDGELVHEGSALGLLGWRARFAERLNVPLLVPTFPRPRSRWWTYTHALDNETMASSVEGLVRIDLQIIEMIDDARERLAELHIGAGEKVLMLGFSASGQFTSRFAILHPERTLAAAPGSPGGWPLAPVGTWQGEILPYHVGIADVESFLGYSLDMDAVRAVPIFLYMGDADTNDAVPTGGAYGSDLGELACRLFGDTPVARWPHYEAMYDSVGMNATFRLYPGIGHTISDEMFDDIADFFLEHLPPP
jgi:hypothetical protein